MELTTGKPRQRTEWSGEASLGRSRLGPGYRTCTTMIQVKCRNRNPKYEISRKSVRWESLCSLRLNLMIPMVVSRTRLKRKNQEEHNTWRGRGGEEEEEEVEEEEEEEEEEEGGGGGGDYDDDDDDDDGGGADAGGGGDESRDWSLVHCRDFSTDLKTSSHHCLETWWQNHVVF